MEAFHGGDGRQEDFWNSGGVFVDRRHTHKRAQLVDWPHSQTSQNHPRPEALSNAQVHSPSPELEQLWERSTYSRRSKNNRSLVQLRKLGHRPGGYVNAVEDYWPRPGRSLMWAHPYLSWLSNIKALKLVKAVAGLEKSDSDECIKLASMTPGNTEYPKYNLPGA